MNEVLLQTVVEKLNDIELLVRDNDQNKTREELKKISEELKILSDRTISAERINELINGLDSSTGNLKEPVQKIIEHHHHLHKGIWIAIVLFVANIFLLSGWINSYNKAIFFKATNVKYRALKTIKDEGLKKLLYNTDSLYKTNAEYFEKMVIKKETSR